MVNIAMHDPFEAVAQPDDVYLVESGADGGRADDAVDAGGRPATDEDREIVMVLHGSMIPESRTISAAIPAAFACVGAQRRVDRAFHLRFRWLTQN
jgi:hypothetical protein